MMHLPLDLLNRVADAVETGLSEESVELIVEDCWREMAGMPDAGKATVPIALRDRDGIMGIGPERVKQGYPTNGPIALPMAFSDRHRRGGKRIEETA